MAVGRQTGLLLEQAQRRAGLGTQQPVGVVLVEAEAKASGRLFQMSILPLPSRSTAHLVKVEGMNCMLPMAPAHEPRIWSLVMWFMSRMRRACTVSLLKKAVRLVMQASVETERTTRKSPM